MQRKAFIKNTTLCAIAISTSGFIRFDGKRYEGDCETTSDILGPFYRPGSPVRNNLVKKDMPGQLVELTGFIRHDDCKTPFKNAKVELWHCSSAGIYDNSSDEFLHRGTTYTDVSGKYFFKTILPTPYQAGGGMRPAHFHMMVTAEQYQPLVTQLYFSGDKHISRDTWASAPKAKKRILDVQTLKSGSKKVLFDVNLATKLSVEPASIDRLTGVYIDEKDQSKKIEFFKNNNLLWVRNDVFGMDLEYVDNNKFRPRGTTETGMNYLFEILNNGAVKLTYPYRNKGDIHYAVATKQ
jgi:protocatechuate 3,4-dioxygenase beta subunit